MRSFPTPYYRRKIQESNVTLTDEEKLILHCNICGQGWMPNIKPGGKLGREWYKCPNGCIDKIKKT